MVPLSGKIIHTDKLQAYDEIPAPVRPRHLLANWTSVRLGDDPNRPTVQEISEGQLQWNMFNDSNRQGQRHNKTSDEMESVNREPIHSDDGSEHIWHGNNTYIKYIYKIFICE